jgi:hypothetical protein
MALETLFFSSAKFNWINGRVDIATLDLNKEL